MMLLICSGLVFMMLLAQLAVQIAVHFHHNYTPVKTDLLCLSSGSASSEGLGLCGLLKASRSERPC